MGGYFVWQFWSGPKFLIQLFWNVERMLLKAFSVSLMLQTLFSHWHRDAVQYRGGFGDIGLAFAWNAISRIIGLLVRTIVLLLWLITSILIAIAIPLICLFFIAWPVLTLVALFLGFRDGSWPHILAACASMLILAWVYERTRPGHTAGPNIAKEAHSFADLIRILKKHPQAQEFFGRLMIPAEDVNTIVAELEGSGMSWDTFQQSIQNKNILGVCVAACSNPALKHILQKYQLRDEDIAFMLWWLQERADEEAQAKRWWSREHLANVSGVGLSWAAGYTPFIDAWSHIPRGDLWDVSYGHEEEVRRLINSLARRSQSNVLLVGQAGTGRLGVIRRAAQEISTSSAHIALNNQRIVYIHIGELLGLGSSVPEQLHIIAKALLEMERAGNIITVLDGVSSVLGGMGDLPAGRQGGMLNATDILVPFLTSQTVRTVIIMSDEEYDEGIAQNEELAHLFDVVRVRPLSEDATLHLLALAVRLWESEGNISIPYQTLRETIERTSAILPNIPYPERAFDVLEEALASVRGELRRGDTHLLLPEEVTAVISRKLGFDMSALTDNAGKNLLGLEDVIHERVVNQSEAVRAVAHAMIRARAGVRNTKKPIGTFLFLGPTGVGKTETAKALAYAHFGSSEYLVRLDMQQFQEIDTLLPRLTSLIEVHPFAVLLLDEFEKASRQVQQLFLTVFDEGYVKDTHGRSYACTHMIIIATSNAGSEFIRSNVLADGTLPQGFNQKLTEHVLSQDIFTPELVNRFDGVITFTPLSPNHIREVARRMLAALNMRLDEQHGVGVQVTDELIDYLVSVGFDPEFGARPMARAIQDTVEYAVSEAILKGSLVAGQSMIIDPRQFG